jgi:uncharacterized iron-regulated membrane protein
MSCASAHRQSFIMSLHNLVVFIRKSRVLHKWIGISIVFFLLITATTGLLLGWKKNVDVLQPPTLSGSSIDFAEWKSFEVIAITALRAIDSITHEPNTIDRYDVRPDKGIVKVIFSKGYWEVQVDGKTAKALSVARRHSDWIEHIHDGSILSEFFKLSYTSYLGLGLLLMSFSGLLLWLGPLLVRKKRNQ